MGIRPLFRWGDGPFRQNGPFIESRLTQSGILRLYVDGTTGDDAASGQDSWANAWKTLDHALLAMATLLFIEPNNLTLEVFCRNTIATDDVFASLSVVGNSRFYIGQHVDDFEVVRTGTVTAVGGEAGPPKHGLERLTVNIAGLDGTEVGCTLKLVDPVTGTNRGTCTILRVNVGSNYLWVSQGIGEFPAWVAASPADLTICRPSAYVTGALTVDQRTTVAGSAPASCPYSASALIGLRVGGRTEMSGLGAAMVACYARNLAGAWKDIYWQSGHLQQSGYFRFGAAYGLPDTIAQDYGLIGGVTPTPNNCVGNASNNEYGRSGCRVNVYGGYHDTSLAIDSAGATVLAQRTYAKYFDVAAPSWMSVFDYMASGTATAPANRAYLGGFMRSYNFTLVDVPATGTTAIYMADWGGFIRVSNGNVEGNNTGSSADRYGAWARAGGRILFQAAITDAFKAKTTRFRNDDGAIEFDSTLTIGSSEGAGPDFYAGSNSITRFGGNVSKSATNGATGGAAKPILEAAAGARVQQAPGATFVPATPGSNNWSAGYSTDGAVYIHETEGVRLGIFTGGIGTTIGVGCKISNGSKLIHAGAGLSGTAPLELGASVAQAWPVAVKSDLAEVTPQDCWVFPNVA